jgi:hypothetical protein
MSQMFLTQNATSGFSGYSGFSGANSNNALINPRFQIAQYRTPAGGAFSAYANSGSSGLFSGHAWSGTALFSGLLCSGTGIPAITTVIQPLQFSAYLNANFSGNTGWQCFQFWQQGAVTNAQANVTALQSTAGLYPGMYISCPNFSANATIQTINSGTSFSASQGSTSGGTSAYDFCVPGCTNGQAAAASGQFGGGDRWLSTGTSGFSGATKFADIMSVRQLQTTPGGNGSVGGPSPDSNSYLQAYFNTVQGGLTATARTIEQRIESAQTFAGIPIYLSFWMQTVPITKPQASPLPFTNLAVTVNWIQNFGTGGSATVTTAVGTANLSTDGLWHQFNLSFTPPSVTGKLIPTANTDFASLQLSFPGSLTQNIFCVNLTDVILSNTPIPMPYRSNQQELALCQRYFFAQGGASIDSFIGVGIAQTTGTARFIIQLPVQMRANCAPIFYSSVPNALLLTAPAQTGTLTVSFCPSSEVGSQLGVQQAALDLASSNTSFTAGGGMLFYQNSPFAYWGVNAEL